MPHLLVTRINSSSKSVMINTILTSLLYHNTPSDLKLILVDPKQVELTPYDGIPLFSLLLSMSQKSALVYKMTIEDGRRLKT